MDAREDIDAPIDIATGSGMAFTRPLLIMTAVALASALAGWQALVRPARTRRWLALPAGAPVTYILRLAGTMCLALGAILFCFAVAYATA